MPKETRQERIEKCGKREALFINKVSGTLSVKKLYCGIYYGEEPCESCKGYELYLRKKIVEDLVIDSDFLYRALVSKSKWNTVRSQLARKGCSGIRVPQSGDTILIYSTGSPYTDGRYFEKIDKHVASNELSLEENLFCPHGNRSTFGTWSLSGDGDDDENSIEINVMMPAFDRQVDKSWLEETFSLHATTWTGGKVTLDNIQEFYNFAINKGLEFAFLQGKNWDMGGTKMQKLIVTQKMIDGWSIGSVNKPELKVQGDRARTNKQYLLEINEIEPTDHVAMYQEYLETDKKKADLGVAYDLLYNEDGTEKNNWRAE